jgi:hypothetical protein
MTAAPSPEQTTDPVTVIDVPPLYALEAVVMRGYFERLHHELARINAGAGSDQLKGTLQLGAVIGYLQSDPAIRSNAIHKPLLQLFAAMSDFCAGHKPAYLSEVERPVDVVTKPKFAFAHHGQGVLAIAYAALTERGRYKPAAARAWLDKRLQDCGLAERGTDAHGWYRQIKAGRGTPAQALVGTFKYYEPELKKLRDAADAEVFATKCVAAVRALGLPRVKLRS